MSAPTTAELRGAFLRYRALAWTTGTLLALLVFVAMPLKYLVTPHHPVFAAVFGIAHGWVFVVYLIVTLQLGMKLQWPWLTLGLRMLAGVVPLACFFVEHKVHRELAAQLEGASAGA